LKNSRQLQAFQYVDQPMTQRWAEMVRDTVDQLIGYLIKVGALLDGRIDFRVQDNTLGQLEAGHAIFFVDLMPPVPAQWIQFNIILNPQYLLEIFPSQT
jgi:phage tail sheath protein FI